MAIHYNGVHHIRVTNVEFSNSFIIVIQKKKKNAAVTP